MDSGLLSFGTVPGAGRTGVAAVPPHASLAIVLVSAL